MTKSMGYGSKIYSLSGAFHLTIAIVLAVLATILSHKIIPEAITSIPWGVISILLLPTGYNVNLLIKLSETKKNTVEDLSRSETRALDKIINRKKNNALLMLLLQLAITSINIILSIGKIPDFLANYNDWFLSSVIGLTICALYLVVPSVMGIREVNDFEAIIKARKSQHKRLKATLDKLK